MTGPAYDNRNRSTGIAVREAVALYLEREGFDVTVRRPTNKLSEATEDALVPDIDGLPDTWVTVSSRQHPHRFWETLAIAERGAVLTGRRRGVVVQWRSSEPVGQSFVVMTLDTFAGLIGAQPS